MPRGYPDDGIQSDALGQTVIDNSELAARLGALSVVQRSGYVIYQTKFADGMTDWNNLSNGFGYAKVRANLGIVGTTCMELYSGIGVGDVANVYKYLPLIDTSKIGIEFYIDFQPTAPAANTVLYLYVYIYFANTYQVYTLKFLPNTQQIQVYYYDAGGVGHWYNIDVPFQMYSPTNVNYWHYVKLTIDLNTLNYKSLLFDDLAYNLTQLSSRAGAYVGMVTMIIEYYATPIANANVIHIGSTVVTMNEP